MHTHSLERWQHSHIFLGAGHDRHARRTLLVVALTAAMMVAEIVGGTIFGSMAVVADGWHMSTHAGALLIAALAYRFARRHADDAQFTFGTGKVGELAAFSSALILALIAGLIGYEAVRRLYAPVGIDFAEATWLAVVGLAVNLASAALLFDGGHGHDHDHHGRSHGHHHDTNLRAAYVHVLADAATSVLAIAGLGVGWSFGWSAADPIIGIVGACVILSWSVTLIRNAAAVLLDRVPLNGLDARIRRAIEIDDDRVCDLHVWRLGPGHHAAIVSVVSDRPQPPAAYKERLRGIAGLSHVTVEVEPCQPTKRLSAA
jgi:cation diffusion facilitator family transporter